MEPASVWLGIGRPFTKLFCLVIVLSLDMLDYFYCVHEYSDQKVVREMTFSIQ